MKKKIACLALLTAVLVAECMGGNCITAKAATTETTVENQTEFVKDYTEEHYGVGQGKYSADGRDNVTKYSFRTEAEIPYYVGREDKKATNFLKKNKHDAVLYMGMPLFLTTAMDKDVYSVSVSDETVAKVEGNELVGLKQGVFTLTTYDKKGKKIEDIKYAVTTWNDSKTDIATAMSIADVNEKTSVFEWGITKDLPYWRLACNTLMDVSFYFQARGFYYSGEGEPECNSLNGSPTEDWMYNNEVETVFEANKGVCLNAAQMAAYLLADDFEDWGVVCIDGMQGHIFNWYYEDGLYYIFDYTSVISYNAWGRDTDKYVDFSNEVKVCKSIEEIKEYVCTEKVDTTQNYFIYMYSLRGHDELPAVLNTAKYSSRDALNGKYEEIIVGYQDIVVEDLHVLYLKKGINLNVQGFSLEEMPSKLVHGRYNLAEEYKYYYDYE